MKMLTGALGISEQVVYKSKLVYLTLIMIMRYFIDPKGMFPNALQQQQFRGQVSFTEAPFRLLGWQCIVLYQGVSRF